MLQGQIVLTKLFEVVEIDDPGFRFFRKDHCLIMRADVPMEISAEGGPDGRPSPWPSANNLQPTVKSQGRQVGYRPI